MTLNYIYKACSADHPTFRSFDSSVSIGHFGTNLSLSKRESECNVWLRLSVLIHIETRTYYYSKNFGLTVALKERLKGTPKRSNG